MAIRTQIRMQQITASFGNAVGKIRDDAVVRTSFNAMGNVPNLSGSLSEMASAIKRINGGAIFAGTAASTLKDASSVDRITYINGAGTIFKSEDGTETALTIGSSTGDDKTVTAGGTIKVDTITDTDGSSGVSVEDVRLLDGQVTITDDKKLMFGSASGGDASIEYDEDGDDVLQIAGANVRIGHGAATQLQFRDSAVHISSDADGYLSAQADTGVNINVNGTDEIAVTATESTFGGNIAIPNDGTIGSAGAASAMTIASDGIVTFVDDIKLKNDGTIGAVGAPSAITLGSTGIVTFNDDIKLKDEGTIGNASVAEMIQLETGGNVEVKNDLKVTGGDIIFGNGQNANLDVADVSGANQAGKSLTILGGAGTGTGDGGSIVFQVADGGNTGSSVNAHETALTIADDKTVTAAGNVVITGNLDVNGTTTTIDTTNLSVEDSIIALGVSGSDGSYTSTGQRGILFPIGANHSKVAGFYYDSERFKLAKTLTGPTSGSFGTIADGDHQTLQLGKVEVGGTSDSMSLTESGESLTLAAGNRFLIDSVNAIRLDSASGDISFLDDGTEQLAIDMDGTAGEIAIQLKVDSDDLVFKQYDGTEVLRLTDAGDVEVKDDLHLKSDEGVLGFGADASPDTTLTHVTDTGLLLNSTRQLQFSDANSFISNPGAGLKLTDHAVIEVEAATSIQMDSPIIDFEDDGVVLQFGDGDDVTLTHVHDTGLLLNSSRQIQFGDSATHIKQVSDSNLEIEADGSVILDAPEVLLEDDTVALKLGSAQQFVLTHANDNTGATITSTHRLNFGAPNRTISDDGTGITMEAQYIAVGNRNVGPGKIRFQENTGDGSHFAEIQGRAVGSSYGLVLPEAGGTAGQFLKVDSIDGINRQLIFADVGAGASSKIITNVTASVPAGQKYSGASTSFDLSAVSEANAINAVDVFVNGQLLQSSSVAYGALAASSAGDYAVNTDSMAASHVKFTFDIEQDDTVSIIVRA